PLPHDASRRPSAEKATALTAAVCPPRALTSFHAAGWPAVGSHSLTVWSPPADATHRPSVLIATALTTAWWPCKDCSSLLDSASHSFTCRSAAPETTYLLSGLKAADQT